MISMSDSLTQENSKKSLDNLMSNNRNLEAQGLTQSQIKTFNELHSESNNNSSFKIEMELKRKKSKSQSSFYPALNFGNQNESLESHTREDSQESKKFDDLIHLLDRKLKKAGKKKNKTKRDFGKKYLETNKLKKTLHTVEFTNQIDEKQPVE